MQIKSGFNGHEAAIAHVFIKAFSASEGAGEGEVIGELVRDLLASTPDADIRVFRAVEGDQLSAAVIFTRLIYPGDARRVVLLSPMAVMPDRQRQGIGLALIRHGLDALRSDGAEVAITYGDPAYYGQVGFNPITEDQARAPLPLSQPQGWIGQSLTGGVMPTLAGQPACVPALNRPDIW